MRRRAPDGRRHDSATMCAVVTFSCMLTEPAGAPMMRATLLPTSSGISHQRSSQRAHAARRPRVGVLGEVARRPRGIAPSELLIM